MGLTNTEKALTQVHSYLKTLYLNIILTDSELHKAAFGAMSSYCFALTLHLLLFLLVYADSANSQQVHYYITPSLSVHCPGDSCRTLPQLAANSTSYLGNETNISLTFLPGNHSLDGELSLSHADNFSMTKVIGGTPSLRVWKAEA